VEEQFHKAGTQVRADRVPGVKAWYHHGSWMRVVAPVEQELNRVAILGSAATPSEGITAEVADVGRGLKHGFDGRDLTAP